MFIRFLILSQIVAIGLGVITATPPRLAAIADDPGAIARICEIGMIDARWQDPPFFAGARLGTDPPVVEITGKNLLFVCPVKGGTRTSIVVIAECPDDTRVPCRARRYR